MWYKESVFYHIYPLGFCGAPEENDGQQQNRIGKVKEWIPHLKEMGINALYFGPVFESDKHGYDTRDYRQIDCRLGNNEQFAAVVQELHAAGIRVILDGVFNHVGRGFWAFQDVKQNREHSKYKDWFQIDFGGDSCYHDGFWYEGWEGHYELVKLNLHNHEVTDYLFDCVREWIELFEIDGLRLDVAYMLDHTFMRNLRTVTKEKRDDFFLLGEMIHGDYNQIVNPEMLDSCTNYEAYKGLHSSFNSQNMFEISYSINRQFGPDHWTLYKGKQLMNFADNHDTDRIASILEKEEYLKPLYGLLFAMPGIPCIYYGSEWGIKGVKANGSDSAVRPNPEAPVRTALTEFIQQLTELRKSEKALISGDYRQIHVTNKQYVFRREADGEIIYAAVNLDDQPYEACIEEAGFAAQNLVTGVKQQIAGCLQIGSYTADIWKCTK